MRLVLALLLVPALAFAEPPDDAPTLDSPGRSVVLEPGQPAPYRGVLLDEQETVRRERRAVRAEVTLRHAQQSLLLPPVALVAIIAGALAVGAGVSAAVAVAVRK